MPNQTTQTVPAPAVATTLGIPFNPFLKLELPVIVALTGRYNKAWKTAHAVDIALAQTEFNCSVEEACFYADLKSTGEAIIDRETITEVGDSLAGMVRGLGTPNKDVTLGLMKNEFDALKPELRNSVGQRVRDNVLKVYESATASKLLGILYTHLDVREKDWMR